MLSNWRVGAGTGEWEFRMKFSSLSCTSYNRHGMSSGTVISSILFLKTKSSPNEQ